MRLAELIGTLSLATDAGTGMPEETGPRVASVAAKIGAQLGATTAECSSAYYLALLRWIGCSADSDTAADVFGDEVSFGTDTQGVDYGDPREMFPAMLRFLRKGKGTLEGMVAIARAMTKMPGMKDHARAHCEVADLLAARLGFDQPMRAALVQNGERYDGTGGPDKVKGEAIAFPMRVAQAAYEAEIGHRFGGKEGLRQRLLKLRGTCLDPAIVDAIVPHVDDLAAVLSIPSAWAALLEAEPRPHREVSDAGFDEALAVMATFADLKSTYTRSHSTAVAELASEAARSIGLPPEVVADVRRAGLLHDLGRVAVSTGVWDKAEPLTDAEREKIRMHSYVGERVLARAPSLARIAEIASLAHERLDGTGYHRRMAAAQCAPAARILAAADVYRALVEDRPHRPAFTPAAAATELTRMVKAGALCPDASAAVLAAAGHAPAKVGRASGLTDREIEVLRLVTRGMTNKEIASRLDISTKTAGHHVQHIFEKLGVTTRAAAATCAMERGLVV